MIVTSVAQCSAADGIADSVATETKSKGLFQRIVDYVASSNNEVPSGKIDFSVLGGPYYSQDTGLGIGLVAAGLYRTDSVGGMTQFSVYGDFSVTGYYKIGIDGTTVLRNNKFRLDYDAYFYSRPDCYWGIGYAMNTVDENMVKYKRWKSQLQVSALFQMPLSGLYIGPVLQLDYVEAKTQPDPALWRWQDRRTFTDALGLGIVYDTRDNIYNAYSGIYVRINQLFAAKFMLNKYAFVLTEGTLCHYREYWSGGVVAMRFHARLTYGNTPWSMMSELGGSDSMRGYREGRYNDKCAADATVELRQHLFRRFGCVVWGGVGEVFPDVDKMFRGHLLWNAGVGLRWEFKHRVNIRLDYGFGKGQSGFVFSINEAF